MAALLPVDHDPFAESAQPRLVPVDHDPFQSFGPFGGDGIPQPYSRANGGDTGRVWPGLQFAPPGAPAGNTQDLDLAASSPFSPPRGATPNWPTQAPGVQLAGIARPFPGFGPPPPVVPGIPEWSDHFAKGMQGLINAFKRYGSGGSGRPRPRNDDDDDDECGRRYNEEYARCGERKDEYAHPDFLWGCRERAKYRSQLCLQNKGRPDPNEPSEWGPKDEEIWRNYGR
jgi:hypothetical protein